MRDLVALFLGGGFGATARYGTALAANRYLGVGFPWGTLVANVVGSLLIGILMHFTMTTEWMTPRAKLGLVTGFCGAYTTFSTFSYETLGTLQAGQYKVAAVSIVLNLGLCLSATWLGYYGASRIP